MSEPIETAGEFGLSYAIPRRATLRSFHLALANEELEDRRTEIDLRAVWHELVQGASVIVETFFTGKRCGLTMRHHSQGGGVAPWQQQLLEHVLSGTSQNSAAIDFNVAPSTVATWLREALARMGVDALPSKVHPVLILAAVAGHRHISVSATLDSHLGEQKTVISIPRPGQRAGSYLSTSELEVASKLAEGCSYVQIAQARGTAARTVANQVAAVFKRLNVSGRGEMVLKLLMLDGVLPPVAKSR